MFDTTREHNAISEMESQRQAEMGGIRMELKNEDIVDIRKYGSGSGNVCDFELEAEMGRIRVE